MGQRKGYVLISSVDERGTDKTLGAWVIHFILIILAKIIFDAVPGMSQETSWTLTNISYMAGSYIMFHYVQGTPFEFNSGAFDNLNLWEQIDRGDQYTPTKKFLLFVPIFLFLLSTHYTHYDLAYFTINCLAVIAVVIPKLPSVSTCLHYMACHAKSSLGASTSYCIVLRSPRGPTMRLVYGSHLEQGRA